MHNSLQRQFEALELPLRPPRKAEYDKYLRMTEWHDFVPKDRTAVNWLRKHIRDPARKSENAAKACSTIDDISCGTIDDIKGKSGQSVTRKLEPESRDRRRSLPSLRASLCV